jgi:hypothetical protein
MSVIHVLPILININDKKRRNTLIKRSKTLRNGQERSGTVKNAQERSGTVKNVQERWTVRNDERSGTVNGQGRWTVRDVERYATIILYKVNGLKRLQNHVHGTFTFTFQKRKKHCISVYLQCINVANCCRPLIWFVTFFWLKKFSLSRKNMNVWRKMWRL